MVKAFPRKLDKRAATPDFFCLVLRETVNLLCGFTVFATDPAFSAQCSRRGQARAGNQGPRRKRSKRRRKRGDREGREQKA